MAFATFSSLALDSRVRSYDEQTELSLPKAVSTASMMLSTPLDHAASWLAFARPEAFPVPGAAAGGAGVGGAGDGGNNSRVPAWAAYSAEAGCAVVSAGLVAPLVGIIDEAIFSNASGRKSMGDSLKDSFGQLVKQPGVFFRGPTFRWIWLVYGGTYVFANITETACNRNGYDWFVPKFIASSFANVSLSVTKDRAFSKMFGTGAAKPVPARSAALYGLRDCMTVGGSFNLPTVLSTRLQENGMSKGIADPAAQLFCPCFVQLFNTPFHLLGMNFYNEPVATAAQRRQFILDKYPKTLFARWGRIFPAFGIGGLINKPLRKTAQEQLDAAF